MAESELDQLVNQMAALLDAPCVLEDSDFNLVCHAAQADVDSVREHSILQRRSTPEIRDWFNAHGIRTQRQPIRTPADAALGIAARLCVPARHLNRAYGYFWVIDRDDRIPQELWSEAMLIADTAGLLLSQSGRLRARLKAHIRDILTADRNSARRAAEEVCAITSIHRDEAVVAICVAGDTRTLDLSAQRARHRIIWVRESPETALVIAPATAISGYLERGGLLPALTSASSQEPVVTRPPTFGVGRTVPSILELAESRASAQTALWFGDHSPPEPRESSARTTLWDDLGVLRLAGILRRSDALTYVYCGQVGSFALSGDSVLVETAATYLDEGCSAARTAHLLSIHRQTLYHRLHQIERLCQVDLTQGRDRLELHLALVLRHYVTGKID